MSSLRQLGQYRLDALLKSSQFADTYRATDTVRRRSVILHALKRSGFSDPNQPGRVLDTALGAIDLVHPHLAWVWEADEADGTAYVVERFIDGPSLREWLSGRGPLSWAEASRAIEQLAQGLDFAHSRGCIHAGVRPDHIFLSPELGGVLGGLGLAGLPASPDDEPASRETARYWAPEIWRGEGFSAAADRYALACILVEMLTGKPLFDGETLEAIRERHLAGPEFSAVWPEGTPWEIELALERALAHDPATRYPSAAQFAEAPEKLASEIIVDENERQRREALRSKRMEAEAQAQATLEEAARLAALEQARREIEEQSALSFEAALPELNPPGPADADSGSEPGPPPAPEEITGSAPRHQQMRQSPGRQRLWAWLGGAALLLAILWAWNRDLFPSGLFGTPTPTATTAPTAVSTRPPATHTLTPAPSLTHTPEPTLTATSTRRPTATHTLSPTPTASPTPTETRRPQPTSTRERPDDNSP